MCVHSCLTTTGYIFLLLAALACALSYCAPFWILFPSSSLGSLGSLFAGSASNPLTNSLARLYADDATDLDGWWVAGLWSACERDGESDGMPEVSCSWFWERDFAVEKGLPDWHKATQGLFGGGVVLLIVGFFLATFHICCGCLKESYSCGSAIGAFIAAGTISVGIGLGLYAGFMHKDHEVGLDEDKIMFYWGFFVGIAGFLLALVSGILFFCQGCCGRNHTGYEMTRVV